MGNEILRPNVQLNLVSADTNPQNAPQKVLLVGILGSGATASSGALVQNIPNDGSESTLFGTVSMLTEMVKTFKTIAPEVQLDAIGLTENGSGTAAAYTITISGTATEAGTVELIVGSKRLYSVRTSVASGATASGVATALALSIGTITNCPFAAVPSSGVVTLTYTHKGTFGNGAPIAVNVTGAAAGTIAGLTFTVAQSVQGVTNPTSLNSATFLNVASNIRHQGVVWPDFSTFNIITAYLDGRFNSTSRLVDGVAFVGYATDWGTAITDAEALNSKSGVIFIDKLSTTSPRFGPAGREPGHLVAASFAALRALRLTKNASISQYLTTKSSSDQFGGPALASLPYFNSTIPTLSIPSATDGYTAAEITTLETAGASVIGQNVTHTGTLVGPVVTTYKTDPAGNPDPSWKYLNYVDTMSQVREYFVNNYRNRFGQSRLTEGKIGRAHV